MNSVKQRLKDEALSLARQVMPSTIRCCGSPHRPNCQIPLYHNMAEEKIRRGIVERTIEESKKIDPANYLNEDAQAVLEVTTDGIENWCTYCIVAHPKLNEWFDRGTRRVNKLALKRYDKKYREDET